MGIASECSIGMPELLSASRIISGKAFAMTGDKGYFVSAMESNIEEWKLGVVVVVVIVPPPSAGLLMMIP
jgi:hypothetical protein